MFGISWDSVRKWDILSKFIQLKVVIILVLKPRLDQFSSLAWEHTLTMVCLGSTISLSSPVGSDRQALDGGWAESDQC